MVHLGDFTTNIVQGGKSTKFLKTKVSVRTSDEDVSEEIKKSNVVIRDSVIKALSSKQFEQVATQQGKLLLKEEVSKTLNGILTEGEVEEVFFTEFIIQ
jgi:flagellar FliL protein